MNDLGLNNMNYIKGSVPEAVIIPSDEHMFTIMEEAVYSDPVLVGIGNLAISDEMIIYDKISSPLSEESKTTSTNMDEKEYINLFISHNIK
jgi:hypothetical protein